jgi:hypothetical protein
MTDVIKKRVSLAGLYRSGEIRRWTIADKMALVMARVPFNGGQLPFLYEDRGRLNNRLAKYLKEAEKGDRPGFPVSFMLAYPPGSIRFAPGTARDAPDVHVGFVTDVPKDFCGALNERVISRMKHLAIQFLREYNRSRLFQPLSSRVYYDSLVDEFSSNVAGVLISFQAEEAPGFCIPADTPWDWSSEDEVEIDIQHTEGTPCGC